MSVDDELERSLKRCRTIAAQEAAFVADEMRRAGADLEHLVQRLDATIAATLGEGAAVVASRGLLQDLRDQLGRGLASQLDTARRSAEARAERISKFTVALFGRTMAGKSTLREALTGGDGSTIGRGGQNTTREVREYVWNGLAVLDAPGIATADEALRPELDALAREAWLKSDVAVVLLSSDGIQEAVFDGLAELRDAAKPVIFVLNYKEDLTKEVLRRRFLTTGGLGSTRARDAIDGHLARLRQLAIERLGMPRELLTLRAIHAQCAFLGRARRSADDCALYEHSRVDDVRDALANEVVKFGGVRRLQTFLDGAANTFGTMEAAARTASRSTQANARYLDSKSRELARALDDFTRRAASDARRVVEEAIEPLRRSVGTFIEENLESRDVARRWQARVVDAGVYGRAEAWQQAQIAALNGIVSEYARQLEVEQTLGVAVTTNDPEVYDPIDLKRGAGWVGAGAGAVLAILELGAVFNWWNPVGWVAGSLLAVTAVAGLLGWIFDPREKKLEERRKQAGEQLRRSLDAMTERCTKQLVAWFRREIVEAHVRPIRAASLGLPHRLHTMAGDIESFATSLAGVVATSDVRLYRRTAQETAVISSDAIVAVAREPGELAKVRTRGGDANRSAARALSDALCERVDLVPTGEPAEEIAAALRPAHVDARRVSLVRDTVRVRVARTELGRAIGRRGINVRLAGRLVGRTIKVEADHD